MKFASLHLFAASAVSLCSGCIAVSVGKPETLMETNTVVAASGKMEVASAKAKFYQYPSGDLYVSLEANVREVLQKTVMKATVEKRRKMAFGLFPGAAELVYGPCRYTDDGVFGGGLGHYCVFQTILAIPLGFIHQISGTGYSLFVAPFDGFECIHDGTHGTRAYSDVRLHTGLTHYGLVGFHKYTTYKTTGVEKILKEDIHDEEFGRMLTNSAAVLGQGKGKSFSEKVQGPYEVELCIPDLGWRECRSVPIGDTHVAFHLPYAENDCSVKAVATFRIPRAAAFPDRTRQAIEKAAHGENSCLVSLRTQPRMSQSPAPQILAAQPVLQPPPRPLYDTIRKTDAENGDIEIRVHVNDTSRTFDIDRQIQPQIRQIFRQEFINRNPLVPQAEIREAFSWTTDETGTEMVYVGGAFSLRPEKASGSRYDDASHRGVLKLRVSGNIPESILRQYVRDNISSLVSEKNVALEAGKAPPPGATYRSLGESFEDGVLTVEFEAVR